ncbi:hypothetical protein cyc_08908 [Cyclospora cayetanensis]|uniref:Uncharacterized protein n=1 Tax=Cyclospora cayetanensis TaxID=88456 RepID=A0A1D3D0D4_9EIME|nr:hypothetical protein cyc_08908 [Cyclospora cayetanensis]
MFADVSSSSAAPAPSAPGREATDGSSVLESLPIKATPTATLCASLPCSRGLSRRRLPLLRCLTSAPSERPAATGGCETPAAARDSEFAACAGALATSPTASQTPAQTMSVTLSLIRLL